MVALRGERPPEVLGYLGVEGSSVPHPLRGQAALEPIVVEQLAARIAKKEPPSNAVVDDQEVEKEEHRGDTERQSVTLK